MQGTYLTIGEGLESEAGNRELTATSVYQMREDLLDYIYDYFRLSDADKQWWKEKEAMIDKPFVWQANFRDLLHEVGLWSGHEPVLHDCGCLPCRRVCRREGL